MGILSNSYPPSAGAINSEYVQYMKPCLDIMQQSGSEIFMDIYPYETCASQCPDTVSVAWGLY